MKSYRQYFGWSPTVILVVLGVLAYICADSSYVKRVGDVATILLALLTSAYVVFTYQILRSTRPQPHVIAALRADEIEILLSIKNIGARPAYDVRVTFDPSLDLLAPTQYFKGAGSPLLTQSFLPPETEVCNLVSSTVKVLSDASAPRRFRVTIRYSDFQRRNYSDSYEIDLGSYVFENKFLQYDTKHYLKDIADTLKEINKTIARLVRPPADDIRQATHRSPRRRTRSRTGRM